MRIAAIDVGTNTVLLLVADIDATGGLHPVEHQQRLPRLGKDVEQSGRIAIGAFDRVAWVISEYKNLSRQLGAETIVACGTSALRDALNSGEFLSYIRSATGIDIETLSGEEEALWSFRGALSGSPGLARKAAVIDIGGGSTEITYHPENADPENTPLQRHSMQLGSVRLTERFFRHDPPEEAEIHAARQCIKEEFSHLGSPGFSSYRLVGVAGTVTTLACLDQKLMEFEVEKVSGYAMSRETVSRWAAELLSIDSSRIRGLSDTTEGRADILSAGALVLSEFMERFGFESVVVSERGLRYGLAIREWERVEKQRS